jgi:ubiquinone/menaquinone biosynthesis C-methylase UbiE
MNDPDEVRGVAHSYVTVTEMAGTQISRPQLGRMYNRYHFAAERCRDKDVLELACGSGPGLGMIARRARSVVAADVDPQILEVARRHYGTRIALRQMDAQALPCDDASFDVVILFEAIYYLADAARFVAEARRVLRPGGLLLVCSANRDLPDFNPSPFSHRYFSVPELSELLRQAGFQVSCWGEDPVDPASLVESALREAKRLARDFGLIPQTMRGKQLLKRLVFGRLVPMPAELTEGLAPLAQPVPIQADRKDDRHRVLHWLGTLP